MAAARPYAFGVIPARGGSKGLPGKNLRKLGALSLIGQAIASAREARLLSRVVVSTDSAEIAEEARQHGAEVPFLRPAELASDQAGMLPVLQHAVRWLEGAAGVRPDLVVTLQPTSPFRAGEEIDRAITKVLETGADSAQTLCEASYHPYFMKTLDGDRTVALFPAGHTFVRRQDAPPVYQPSGAVYVTRYATLMGRGHILGEDNRGVVMGFEASVNIDTEWDFLLAELILREGRAPIPPARR
ncbi:MAG: acylneuraminate cytidylyltransferase family protein [Candidatus Rokubacteria bacterium]|nr:acylneuraminate cytidylyltransferase family protein [Candidatus Rokubacteria bacterium]